MLAIQNRNPDYENKVTLSDNVIDLPTHKTCSRCKQSKLLSEFSKKKGGKYGVRSECKECQKENNRVWYQDNREKHLDRNKTYYQINRDQKLAYNKEYREVNKENTKQYNRVRYEDNKERIKESVRIWQQNNPDKVRSIEARRRAAKKKAFPQWARTGEIKKQIDAIYREAKDLELFHQTKYHVDHIVPLQSNFVCGLHVPINLRPLPGKENLSKSNSFIPYIENSSEIEIDMVELNKMVDHFLSLEAFVNMYIYVLNHTFLKLL
jgi:hypothetical protein